MMQTVRSNLPVPKNVPIYYFEIQILEAGRGYETVQSILLRCFAYASFTCGDNRNTAIGFSPEAFPMNSYVGHTNE